MAIPRRQEDLLGWLSHGGSASHRRCVRRHPELALSAIYRAVTVCLRSQDVGSTSRRFFDRLCLGKNAPQPPAWAASSCFARADGGEWAQGHERAAPTCLVLRRRLSRDESTPTCTAPLPAQRGTVASERAARRVCLHFQPALHSCSGSRSCLASLPSHARAQQTSHLPDFQAFASIEAEIGACFAARLRRGALV